MLKLYDCPNNRLIFIKEKATPDFWDNHWGRYKLKFTNKNRFIKKYLRKYFNDKEGLILEAGCGVAEKVYWMHYNGYNVIGIDYAKRTIITTKNVYPELKLVIGDINHLPFKSNIYRCIWCLGVIEHFPSGFDDAVIEMYRVLQNNGFLFLSFPVLSLLRKVKIKFGLYKSFSPEYKNNFYQYDYDEDFVKKKLERYRFKYVKSSRYDGIKGLKDEIALFKYFLQKIYYPHGLLHRMVKFILNALLNPITGHMCIMVLRNYRL